MKCNKARQNRIFAKRYLERDDCSARSAAQAERGEFPRKRRAALSRNSPWKKGKTVAERVGFSPQTSEKRKGRRGLCRTCPVPFCFSLKSCAAKSHFCQASPLKCAVRIFRTSATSLPSFLSPLLFFSHFLLSFTSLIFFNNSHLYNYVLAIFWL